MGTNTTPVHGSSLLLSGLSVSNILPALSSVASNCEVDDGVKLLTTSDGATPSTSATTGLLTLPTTSLALPPSPTSTAEPIDVELVSNIVEDKTVGDCILEEGLFYVAGWVVRMLQDFTSEGEFTRNIDTFWPHSNITNNLEMALGRLGAFNSLLSTHPEHASLLESISIKKIVMCRLGAEIRQRNRALSYKENKLTADRKLSTFTT
ncbi:hypothetical protein N1851_007763 [Merluccius polli]|uniref:Uncharacterized protein n=1 Tax=Merluccius polli TaxID=89951 RepID=A0AA47P9A3_MERPO|nr:hypothetical protein N1851_007763 [Merluccius polli]